MINLLVVARQENPDLRGGRCPYTTRPDLGPEGGGNIGPIDITDDFLTLRVKTKATYLRLDRRKTIG